MENEKQLLHNVQPSFSNVAFVNKDPLLEESSQIQELGNTAPINNEPFQMQQIQLENNAPLAERREGNEMQVIEILRDLQHTMQYVIYFLIKLILKIDNFIYLEVSINMKYYT